MENILHISLQVLGITLSGAAVTALVLALYASILDIDLKKRFARIIRQNWASANTANPEKAGSRKMANVISMLSRLSVPEEGWQSSSVRLKFLQAGIRTPNAPQRYFALKTLLTLVLPLALALFIYITEPGIPFVQALFLVIGTSAAGYYLPELLLGLITKKRRERMRDNLPDMLDLMVVFTESGMGIDTAITRLSKEMTRTSPDLAQEFYLAVLEMRAGANRTEALRNLALRSGLEDLEDLVAMLIQADKFGTSLAESMRVQSEVMRTKRTQRAEEIAAKIPVKLVLPLGLFIFPTLLLVLLGPAAIQLMQVLSK